jgi:hypothetical protein
MATYAVNILNPKADELLRNLADLKLISISETTEKPITKLQNFLQKMRTDDAPSLEEIAKEVEIVRAERYAKNSY